MANEKDDDLDLGVEEGGGSKKKLIIIIAIAAVLLIGGGAAAWFFLSGDDEAAEEQTTEEGASAEEEEAAPAAEKGEISYHDMSPVFVANMIGKPRMLQLGLQVRIYYPALADFLKHNDPALRHIILNIMSAQTGEELKSREGKDKLRERIKEEINKLISKYKGPGEVDEVLFSSFVMQ